MRFVSAVPLFLLLPLAAQTVSSDGGAAPRPRTRWVTSLQTGMADCFQLTLGGMFGEGPAWQSKVTTGLVNVFRKGDSLYVYGWDSMDSRSRTVEWQAGGGYKMRVLDRRRHQLTLGTGVQHWRFPSVKTGTNDWLIPGNLQYQTKVRSLPLTVTSDSWTLLKSPLPAGSLLHTQAWLEHPIVKHDRMYIAFRHGPAHTYSWNFYGTNGNRVLRYQTLAVISWGSTTVEGGYRKQWALQPGIQANNYWQFGVTRTLTR